MARSPDVEPTPFFLPGGSTGVLLIHGFTGSPAEMRLIGEYLNERGFAISAPLLPGHGTTVEAMNRCRWQDWTDHAEQAYEELTSLCERVFVGGLSMGSLITIYLAAQHQPRGAILYSPALQVANPLIHLAPVFKYVISRVAKSGESDMTCLELRGVSHICRSRAAEVDRPLPRAPATSDVSAARVLHHGGRYGQGGRCSTGRRGRRRRGRRTCHAT